jgi:hypothetical protein
MVMNRLGIVCIFLIVVVVVGGDNWGLETNCDMLLVLCGVCMREVV